MNQLGAAYTVFDPFYVTTKATCPQFNIDQDTTTASCLTIHWTSGQGSYSYYEGPMAAPPNVAWPFKPADVQALDIKLDDGVANTGNITTGGSNGNCVQAPHYGLYNSSYSGYVCRLNVAVGITGPSN